MIVIVWVGKRWSCAPHEPARSNTKLNVSPGFIVESSAGNEEFCGCGSEATRCSAVSVFLKITVVPSATEIVVGENPVLSMVTVCSAAAVSVGLVVPAPDASDVAVTVDEAEGVSVRVRSGNGPTNVGLLRVRYTTTPITTTTTANPIQNHFLTVSSLRYLSILRLFEWRDNNKRSS